MAIRIQTERPEIPIEIGELRFSFDLSDESIKRFREDAKQVVEELQSISLADEKDETVFERATEILRRGYDVMLGEGAFDKIYKLSPSLIVLMDYFRQIAEGIERELKGRGLNMLPKEKAKKYLRKRKR